MVALLCADLALPVSDWRTLAQQQPDTADLQRIISILQLQRNAAEDQAVLANASLQKERETSAKCKADLENAAKTNPSAPGKK